jgi:hypothetical protein
MPAIRIEDTQDAFDSGEEQVFCPAQTEPLGEILTDKNFRGVRR